MALASQHKLEWIAAIEKEILNLITYRVWEECKPSLGVKVLKCIWVF